MKAVRIVAAALLLASASYAWAAPSKDQLGKPLPAVRGAAPARPPVPKRAAPAKVDRKPARFSAALRGLRPEARAATRGANESRVYQSASPAVVLIVTQDGLGSGALVSADGLIVTNLHVVGANDEVGVVFKPSTEGAAPTAADVVMAKVIRRDEIADLALVQAAKTPAGVKPLVVGSASGVQVGSDVHAIGHPTGKAWTYTRGIVSQIRKDYAWAAEDKREHRATVIQTQTPINPGNSGGPLLDDKLEIVGINSFKSGGEGLNFAVSADDVKAFLARTADRVDEAAKEAEACEVAFLAERVATRVKGKEMLVDMDCDGMGDAIAVIPDDAKEPISYLIASEGSETIDTILYDEDRDGDMDFAVFDTDGDGKADLQGEYKDGEDTPFRFERIDD